MGNSNNKIMDNMAKVVEKPLTITSHAKFIVDCNDVRNDLSSVLGTNFTETTSAEIFLNCIKDKGLMDPLLRGWVKIGDKYEYKFSLAFGGERMNVLARLEGQEYGTYTIIFAHDADLFFYN